MDIPRVNSLNKQPRRRSNQEPITRIVHSQPPIRRIFAQGCPIYRETKAPCNIHSRCYTRIGTGTIMHDNTDLYLLMPLKLLAERIQDFVVMYRDSPFACFNYQLPTDRNREAEAKNFGLIQIKIGEVSIEKRKKEDSLSVIVTPQYPIPPGVPIDCHEYSLTDNCFL